MSGTPRRIRTAGLLLIVAGLYSRGALAQCPDNIPQSLVNSVQHPEVRAQAAASPRLTPAFIAQNGGVMTMIQQLRAQIAADNRWLAEEQRNQTTLARQGMSNDARARDGRDLIQRMRDKQRLDQAYLQLLECHAGAAGKSSMAAGNENQAAAAAAGVRSGRDAREGALEDRERMVNKVVGSWQPPRNYTGGVPGAGVSLEDPFALPKEDECKPSISFTQASLGSDGAVIDFEISAVQASGRACMVSFATELRVGSQVVRLPSRTLVIPPTGLTLAESVKLPVALDTTTRSCTAAEPIRQVFLEQRDQLAAKYQKIQRLTRETIESRHELQRSVTMRDVDTAFLRLTTTLDALKLGLSVVHPASGRALDFGQCVGVELASFVGKTVVACSGKDTGECTQTVRDDGALWIEKNLACAFQETFNGVDKLVDAVQIYEQTGEIKNFVQARSKTLDVLADLDASLTSFAARLARMRDDRAFIDESVRQIDELCRSPQIHLTAVDVRVLAGPNGANQQ